MLTVLFFPLFMASSYASDCCSKKKTNLAVKAKKEKGLSIRLLSSVKAFQGGTAFQVGLHIQHEPNYHTYWKNPGIVGVATHLDWQLPAGFSISEPSWPYPEQSKMSIHPCYGYERDVLLIYTITPPAQQQLNKKNYTFKAKGRWMCCAQLCYPGFKDFILTLPQAKIAVKQEEHQALFAKAKKEIPKHKHNFAAKLMPSSSKETIQLHIYSTQQQAFEIIHIFNSDGSHTPDRPFSIKKQANHGYLAEFHKSVFAAKKIKHFPFVMQTKTGYYFLTAS